MAAKKKITKSLPSNTSEPRLASRAAVRPPRPKKTEVYAFLCLVFGLLLTLNSLTPLWGDDWWRALPLNDAAAMFHRIADEYMTWGGRLWVLFLTFLFLLKYPGSVVLFNIANSVAFCLLLVVMFRGATGRYPGRSWADMVLLAGALFSAWFFTQSLGEAVLWKTGAIGYLWTLTAALAVVIPYMDLLTRLEPRKDTRWRLWGLPLFAALWATGLENVSISLVVFMLYALLAARWHKVALPRWYLRVFIGQLAGTVLLLAAPGNFVRSARSSDGTAIYYRLGELSGRIWHHVTTDVPILYAMAALLLLLAFRRRPALKRFYLWLVLGTLFALAMCGSPGVNFIHRTAFAADIGFATALLCLCAGAVSQPCFRTLRAQILLLPLYGVLFGLLGADMMKTLEQYLAVGQQTRRRLELMADYKAGGISEILLPSMEIPYIEGLRDDIVEGRFFLRDLHPDVDDNGWRNGTYARYYGFSFANRLNVPYVLYAPELKSGDRFRCLKKGEWLSIYLRREARGFSDRETLYCISRRRPHIEINEIRVYPKHFGDLTWDERKVGYRVVKARNNAVVLISEKGRRLGGSFISRLELPDWDLERIELHNERLPWPHVETIRFDVKNGPQAEDRTMDHKLSWKGRELHHSSAAIVNPSDGSITAPGGKEFSGFLNWGPYVRLPAGEYAIEATFATDGPGSRWEVVAQAANGPRMIISGTLAPDGGTPQVLSDFFVVNGELIDLPVEFRIDPASGERVTLYRLSIRRRLNGASGQGHAPIP